MPYFLYKRPLNALRNAPPIAPDLRVEVWRPTLAHPMRRGFPAVPFLVWSLFHFLRVFANRDYQLILLLKGDRVVHRTCIVPAHFRFPFMRPSEIQACGIWTDPEFRGRGLAFMALGEAVRRLENPERVLWYLVREENLPSIRLAEKAGFTLFGRVVRLRWLGAWLPGRFLLAEPVERPERS